MKNSFLISTTHTIEGCPIKKYIGAICSNVVIGTNVFSDFAASFTDFFGGRSDSYKRKLGVIYEEASKELKQKAINIGANCIVGFKVDFDEISGKDKSMFMISVSGTACIIDYLDSNEKEFKSGTVSQADLDKEIYRRFVISNINNNIMLQDEWIEFLLENPQIELIPKLLERHSYYYADTYVNGDEVEKLEKVLLVFSKENIISFLYSDELLKHKSYREIIKKGNYFDAKSVLSLVDVDKHLVIDLLDAKSDYYTQGDLTFMEQIVDELEKLPNTGKIETVKGGVFARDNGEKFICENGHKNRLDIEFCEKSNCGINIKGLTKNEVDRISVFKNTVEVLKKLIN